MPHSLFEFVGKLFILPLEQQMDVVCRLPVFFRLAKVFDAGPETSFQMVLETWPLKAPIDLDIAGPQLKRAVYQVERPAG